MTAYERLLAHGIKPSMQRMAVMDYLAAHPIHPSADDIYVALSPTMPTLSKTTVYNTLRLFAERGAVLMLTIDERNAHFDADTSPHAHFLCRRCGRIYDLPCHGADAGADEAVREGHRVMEAHCYYKGVCCQCLEKAQE